MDWGEFGYVGFIIALMLGAILAVLLYFTEKSNEQQERQYEENRKKWNDIPPEQIAAWLMRQWDKMDNGEFIVGFGVYHQIRPFAEPMARALLEKNNGHD